jgi:hypothetical protein
MIHRDPSIRTFHRALSILYSMSDSLLHYRQRFDIRNLFEDSSYSCYIHYRPEHEILTLTFPRECRQIAHLENNYGCKMVYYTNTCGFIQEVEVKPHTPIEVDSETVITIYTRSKPDLVITIDLILSKPVLRSKL